MNLLTSQITGFVHTAVPLPGQAWIPVRILSSLHWCWRWNYKKKIYTDPDNWILLTAGSLTNMCVGNDSWTRTIAHIILITHRTKLYIQQVNLLMETADDFISVIKGRYSLAPRIEWNSKAQSLIPLMQNKRRISIRRLRLIQVTFFRMMVQLYSVTMHAVEIYDAFYRRPEAFNEVFINAQECITDLVKSNFSVLTYIKENKRTIQKLLDYYKMFSIDHVINILDKIS